MVYSEWSKFRALETIMPIICRASNRVFIGAPLCMPRLLSPHLWCSIYLSIYLGRDPDLMKINVDFTVTVIKAASVLYLLPESLKP
jgi:hypothetical protein